MFWLKRRDPPKPSEMAIELARSLREDPDWEYSSLFFLRRGQLLMEVPTSHFKPIYVKRMSEDWKSSTKAYLDDIDAEIIRPELIARYGQLRDEHKAANREIVEAAVFRRDEDS